MPPVPPIVSTSWLKQQLSAVGNKLRILDASWNVLASGQTPYIEKHIPRALFFDLNHCIQPLPTCARNLPDPECLQAYVRSLGIDNDSHVVIYDRTTIHASTKAWWTFKVFGHLGVSVLNGGMRKWEADGFEVVQGEEACDKEGNFELKFNKSLIAEFDDMVEIARNKSSQIVDTRNIEHFSGLEQEPSIFTNAGMNSMGMPFPSSMLAGHIPGSVRIHKRTVLDPQSNCFLSKDELQKLFASRGIDISKPLVSTCYMGHAATLINMAALLCGNENTRLYYGSWTEYGQKATPDLVENQHPSKL